MILRGLCGGFGRHRSPPILDLSNSASCLLGQWACVKCSAYERLVLYDPVPVEESVAEMVKA